jgi:hypothetical protein
VKHPRVKLKRKRQRESGERAETTLVELLALVDALADDREINSIIVRLSPGKRAILYSALQHTAPSLPAPGSAEQPKENRLYALHILRQFLL